ncbi:MAG: hypothetical protein DRP82_06620, partial [Planctomycetota bacterium]
MSTTQRVLHTDSDNHKVVLHSQTVNKRLIRQFVTYDRYPDVKYEYLTSFHAACLILLGVELERCYIPEISVRMFEKAHAALCDKNRRLRIMRYLRKRHPALFKKFAVQYRQRVRAVANAFNPEGRVEIEIAGEKQNHEGPVLNRPIICRSCLIGYISLSGLVMNAAFAFAPVGAEPLEDYEATHIFDEADFSDLVFCDRTKFLGAVFHSHACYVGAIFNDRVVFAEAKFRSLAEFGNPERSNALFLHTADFSYADFQAAAFWKTLFLGNANFANVVFHGFTSFLKSVFASEAHFSEAMFHDKAEFTMTRFCGEVVFWDAAFRGTADFSNAVFIEKAGFQDTVFHGTVKFEAVLVVGAISFRRARFQQVCYLQDVAVGELDFAASVIGESVVLSAADIRRLKDGLSEKEEDWEEVIGSLMEGTGASKNRRNLETGTPIDRGHEGHNGEDYVYDIHDATTEEKVSRWVASVQREGVGAIRAVDFSNIIVQGELKCDFRYLEPRKGEPVIKPHRIALGIDEPPVKKKKRQEHWEEAQKQ